VINSEQFGRKIVPPDVSDRIDKYLAHELSISRSRIQRNIHLGHITVNGESTKPNHVLNAGDIIDYTIPSPPKPTIDPEAIDISVRFEDEHLVVVDKVPGMVVHPAPGSLDGTLVNALLYRYKDFAFHPDDTRPGIVHRLDKDTSGLILVARNEDIKSKLSTAIMEREVKRSYMTLVFGHLKLREGKIDSPIGRHPTDHRRMATFGANPKEAVTVYKVLESYDVCELIEVHLMTGRTHQIRVHFSSIGHPVVGDSLYHGGTGREKGFSGNQREKARVVLSMIDRQALHAYKLEFQHPVTGEFIHVESELPLDFASLLKHLREDAEQPG
jgi:23S rRNA pseudouridine1911/1915/1917 synthase